MNWLITQNFKRLFTHIECCALRTMKNEIWKPIPDYEDFFEVSNLGRVKRLKREISNGNGFKKLDETIMLPRFRGAKNIYTISITANNKTKEFSVGRLVYSVFNKIELDSKFVVIHKDGDKTNCSLDNLKTATRRAINQSRQSKTGITGVREACGTYYVVIELEGKSITLHVSENKSECHKIYQLAKTLKDEYDKGKINILNNSKVNNKLIEKSVSVVY